ncbi:unnamed protein product [Paramecium pentaurelia]|uniref:Uncharacterized protein n=1 Tax=Paramecium pentaurelia TaxID=43138 RepID=A0A8S1XU25_9CILI|nr:unnamed protein product [Paramecium pentaurelia]
MTRDYLNQENQDEQDYCHLIKSIQKQVQVKDLHLQSFQALCLNFQNQDFMKNSTYMMQHQNFQLDQLMIRNLTQYFLITRQNQKKKGNFINFYYIILLTYGIQNPQNNKNFSAKRSLITRILAQDAFNQPIQQKENVSLSNQLSNYLTNGIILLTRKKVIQFQSNQQFQYNILIICQFFLIIDIQELIQIITVVLVLIQINKPKTKFYQFSPYYYICQTELYIVLFQIYIKPHFRDCVIVAFFKNKLLNKLNNQDKKKIYKQQSRLPKSTSDEFVNVFCQHFYHIISQIKSAIDKLKSENEQKLFIQQRITNEPDNDLLKRSYELQQKLIYQ